MTGPNADGERDHPRPVAAVTPPGRRASRTRALDWRSPWTLLLGVFAAFQAGVICALLWRSGAGRDAVVLTPPAPIATAAPPAAPPAGATATAAAPAASTPPGVVASPTPGAPPTAPARKPPRPRGAPAPATPPTTPTAPFDPGAADRLIEVEIVSVPEGATVRIAGAVWGVTPLAAFLPANGPVAIRLELAGHAPATATWSPGSGKRVVRTTLRSLEQP
ncbi:MAG: PEGA domain-containing protein [Kofleriaceae bacterium]|jgi:hypothetical protein|nr:PEGA domain-containing protein [Kofleriaceae bacterium]MBP6839218.1 PEGA domain-containing protein [Kofleriaceae bacterium]MBP9203067.1 PEGA domain-containing protein [Kofleriaceae bacterium]